MQPSEKADVKANNDRVLYWGRRKSDKRVRAYKKREVKAYRVEVELHSSLLRREQINGLDDFDDLPDVLFPKHLQFVDVEWTRLEQHIRQRLGSGAQRVIKGAQKRGCSLSRLRRYLRKKGIVNFHRFLVPLGINKEITRALGTWARRFSERDLNATTQKKPLRTQAAKANGSKAA